MKPERKIGRYGLTNPLQEAREPCPQCGSRRCLLWRTLEGFRFTDTERRDYLARYHLDSDSDGK